VGKKKNKKTHCERCAEALQGEELEKPAICDDCNRTICDECVCGVMNEKSQDLLVCPDFPEQYEEHEVVRSVGIIDQSAPPKIHIIGDVHGCREELWKLIDLLAPRQNVDRLIFTGDLVDRGPASLDVIYTVMNYMELYPGSISVVGNHEWKAMRKRVKGEYRRPWCKDAKDDDWRFMQSMPLLHILADEEAIVVHGGIHGAFLKDYSIDDIPPILWHQGGGKMMEQARKFPFVRHVTNKGKMVHLGGEGPDTQHWSKVYNGCEGKVFFGHDPSEEVRVTPHAVGLDTGCCFGGKLTAATIDAGVSVYDQKIHLTSVPGKAYRKWRKPK
jgi:serine/threonine protein phosphatase 1